MFCHPNPSKIVSLKHRHSAWHVHFPPEGNIIQGFPLSLICIGLVLPGLHLWCDKFAEVVCIINPVEIKHINKFRKNSAENYHISPNTQLIWYAEVLTVGWHNTVQFPCWGERWFKSIYINICTFCCTLSFPSCLPHLFPHSCHLLTVLLLTVFISGPLCIRFSLLPLV